MKSLRIISSAALMLAALFVLGCEKPDLPQPKPVDVVNGGDDPKDDPGDRVTEPAPCTNKVVAHRGGSRESGDPDNSRAGLYYTMKLGCYAMECDIYWTKDNNVVIAHADGDYKINGLRPWEHTLLELRKAGKLKNGEDLPCLEDFLNIVQVKNNCTKLCLDIKNLDSDHTDYPIKAVQRACEIIKEHKAEKFCEFICTSNTTVAKAAQTYMVIYGIPVGWMADKKPADHKLAGFSWANLSAASCMNPFGSGSRTIDEFKNAGMEISVFNIDKQSGDSNAVYSDQAVNYYVGRYADLRFICTNYPAWLLKKLPN